MKLFSLVILLILSCLFAAPLEAKTTQVGAATLYFDELPMLTELIDFSDSRAVNIDEHGFIHVPSLNTTGGSDVSDNISIINTRNDFGVNGYWDDQRNGYISMIQPNYLLFIFDSPVQGFGFLVNDYQDDKPLNFYLRTFGGDEVFSLFAETNLELLGPNQGTYIGATTSVAKGFSGFFISGDQKIAVDDLRFTYTAVPEPVSSVLMFLGGAAMALRRRRIDL